MYPNPRSLNKESFKIQSYEKNEPSTRPRLITAVPLLRRHVLRCSYFFRFHLHITLPDYAQQETFTEHGKEIKQ